MKGFILSLALFNYLHVYTQNHAAAFEKILSEGNSSIAFDFTRNMFGIPASSQPFLHFKERGIKKLISLYDHSNKRIEATSLIKFNQTKEFWKNYSEQFTAGKWNYRTLYKTDSLAWQAANYSITLIYAHEMGHYMSYNFISDYKDDYSCEEVIANECLAAFANAFNGNRKLEMHKQLFLALVKQTAALIPDSAKTDFFIPMEKWCSPDPMKGFFDYFETDEVRFLRLYGFIQFRIMEQTLSNYKEVSFKSFLQKKFYSFYNRHTGQQHFLPLPYQINSRQKFRQLTDCRVYYRSEKTNNGAYFYPYVYNNYRYSIGANKHIYQSLNTEQTNYYTDTLQPNTYTDHILTNNRIVQDSFVNIHHLIFNDSVSSRQIPGKSFRISYDIVSSTADVLGFSYLLKKYISISDTQTLDFDSTNTEIEFLDLYTNDGKNYFRRFILPDTITNNKQADYNEIILGSVNNGMQVVITNELTGEDTQIITIYPVNREEAKLEEPIWRGSTGNKGFFNMQYPTLFLDNATKTINLAFWNPISSHICLLKIKESGNQGFELYESTIKNKQGPAMRVNAMRFTAVNKLQVLAETRKPGNSTEPVMETLHLQW